MRAPPERQETLWSLVVAPSIWAVHFLASYLTVAIWCAKLVPRDGSLGTARVLVFVYTGAALLGVLATGLGGYRRHTFGAGTLPHDLDTPGDRHRFLGFATLLLSGLSAVGIVYAALAAVFIGTCE